MVPSVPMMVSRANTAVIRPIPIFQLKPSGLMAGSMVRPTVPARLFLDRRHVAVVGGHVLGHPENHAHQQDDGAGAVQEDLGAVVEAQAQGLHGGPAVGGHLQQKRRAAALQDRGFQNPGREPPPPRIPARKARSWPPCACSRTRPSRRRLGRKAAMIRL